MREDYGRMEITEAELIAPFPVSIGHLDNCNHLLLCIDTTSSSTPDKNGIIDSATRCFDYA